MIGKTYSPFGLAEECSIGLILAQPAKEKREYKKLLMEDLGLVPATEDTGIAGAGRSRLVEILYRQIMSKGNVDFGAIPQSKGDLAKFKHYKTMAESIDALNQLVGSQANDNMIRMNALHEAIIQERINFEWSYKVGVEFIQYTYCALVEALMDLINENILLYVNYLKETQDIELPSSLKSSEPTRVDRAVDTFLSVRNKGEWKKMMDYYKREYSKRLVAEVMIIGTVSIVGMVALLHAIRSLIYQYYYTATTVDEKARAMSAYISAVSSTETDPIARRRQHQASRKLTSIATFLETRVLKEERKIDTEIRAADAAISKTALTSSEYTTASSTGYDFELL